MVESATDAYTRGYNEGRRDEAEFRTNGGGSLFKTPDVTPAQMVGIASAIVSTALAFGVDLTAMQQHVLIADAGVVAALLFGDAAIRHGRATGNAKKGD
jgi:hypothetical protein